MKQHEISPFLGRDYKHVAHYAPAQSTLADRDRADRLKARMTLERLLHKKWARSGVLAKRYMQRLGDWGRDEGAVNILCYVGMAKALIIFLWLLSR